MTRDEVLALLAEHKPVLAERFGVKSLRLFGSHARDTARKDSDVDVLVSFDGPATSRRYFGTQFYLEDLLGRAVDLVTETDRLAGRGGQRGAACGCRLLARGHRGGASPF